MWVSPSNVNLWKCKKKEIIMVKLKIRPVDGCSFQIGIFYTVNFLILSKWML